MSDDYEPQNDLQNPYRPTNVEEDVSRLDSLQAFGPNYWMACGLLLVSTIALTFWFPPVGAIAIVTACLVIVRSWMWTHRLRKHYRSGRATVTSVAPFHFFVSSIGFSALATFAGTAAFVCTCLPVGFGTMIVLDAVRFGNQAGTAVSIGIGGVVGLCSLVSFWIAMVVLRSTLPSLDPKLPLSIENVDQQSEHRNISGS